MPHSIHYQILPLDPAAHLFSVSLTIHQPDPGGQRLSMAAWIPGSYMIRDFSRHLITLNAESQGVALPSHKLDKRSWQLAPCSGAVTVHYQIYAWDLSVRGAHLDLSHGYFNGTSLLLQVDGQQHLPCGVELLPPTHPQASGWRVATTLPRTTAAPWQFGGYEADSYDALIDHPVEMGRFELVEFDVDGIPHAIAITGRHQGDTERLTRDLQAICHHQIALFGAAPFDSYLFQLMVVGSGYGGLEHRNSTSLICSRNDLPFAAMGPMSEGYRGLLGLCSHEYFHSWNIKRIKPASFIPYQLEKECYTPLLWAFEGITSYYDDLMLLRSGRIDRGSYLELLGQTISRVLQGSGRLKQSLFESSFDAWTKFYQQDENAPNAIVSYYTKGSLVALALDLTLRHNSGGFRSLDGLMQRLWHNHGRPLIGVTTEGLEQMICDYAEEDLTPLLDQALRGTADLPLAELLAPFGITLSLRPAESTNDKGGTSSSQNRDGYPSLGIRYKKAACGVEITHVFEGGAAHGAGLAATDRLIAMNGIEVNSEGLETQLQRHSVGDQLQCHLFRRDELLQLQVTLLPAPLDRCYLQLHPEPTSSQRRALEQWLPTTETKA